MLNFLNKRIYLDFEFFDSYNEPVIMFCPNPYVSKPLHHEIHRNSLTVSELKELPHKDIIMNLKQFICFIHDWYAKSIRNKETQIDIDEWLNDYIDCIKTLSNIMGDTLDYTSRNSIFRQRQKWIIENIDLKALELTKEDVSPIVFDIPFMEGEYSWNVTDYFNHRKHGYNYANTYADSIEEIIEINKCKCFEYQNRTNAIGNYLNFKPFSDFESMDDLCYLYFPLSGESVNSNFIYIRKCLEKYLEK